MDVISGRCCASSRTCDEAGTKRPLTRSQQVYAISYIKLIVTVVKYMPQVWMNYKRKSTTGWNIHQILLDFSGGFLSLSQLIIDASFQADWSGITGNPAKFLLSNVSMFFDVIFITQHYVLYRPAGEDKASEDEEQPLIPER